MEVRIQSIERVKNNPYACYNEGETSIKPLRFIDGYYTQSLDFCSQVLEINPSITYVEFTYRSNNIFRDFIEEYL